MDRVEFNKNILLLKSVNSEEYETGFHSLTTKVDEVLDWLIELEAKETNDEVKSRFIELIGESSNPKAIDIIISALSNSHNKVRMWAYSSLKYSEISECNELAEKFEKNNPNEPFL